MPVLRPTLILPPILFLPPRRDGNSAAWASGTAAGGVGVAPTVQTTATKNGWHGRDRPDGL